MSIYASSTFGASVPLMKLSLAFRFWQYPAVARPALGVRRRSVFVYSARAIVAPWLGGGPTIVIMVTGPLNAMLWLWLPPVGSFEVNSRQDINPLIAWFAVGTLLSFYGGRVRVVRRELKIAKFRLNFALEETGIGIFEIDFERNTVFVSS